MHISKHTFDDELKSQESLVRADQQILLVHRNIDVAKAVFGCLEAAGLYVEYAESSRRAGEMLAADASRYGAVLLDVETAVAEGYNLAETVRCNPDYRAISVATLSENAMHTAQIHATAGLMPTYSYAYPLDQDALATGMQAALDETQKKRQLEAHVTATGSSFEILESCRFKVQKLQDIERAAYMAAACFPQPARAVHGLEELLLNAIEHGNLEIGHALKFELLKAGTWSTEVEKRLVSEEFSHRKVDFAVIKRDEGTSAVITDEGPGFDWNAVLNGSSTVAHGRGLSRARLMSFDKLTFNETGNRVVAFMGDTGDLDW